jgi:hypothetical protein
MAKGLYGDSTTYDFSVMAVIQVPLPAPRKQYICQ